MSTTSAAIEAESLIMAGSVGTLRLALTGAIVASLFFLLCWLALFLPFGSPTHAYLSLFTNTELTSVAALLEGMSWSAAFGGMIGGLSAAIYNALWRLG